jgi:hypothetical protein
MFPVCLSRKAVQKLVEKYGKFFVDDEQVETEVRKWLRQQSKYFYAAGFDAQVERCDKCINIILQFSILLHSNTFHTQFYSL